MSAPANSTTLGALQDAVLAALREQFADRIARYGAYELDDQLTGEPDAAIATPALLFQVERADAEPADPPDPFGRLAVRCQCAIHCLLSVRTERLQAALLDLASEVLASVVLCPHLPCSPRGNRWGLGIAADEPDSASIAEGGFRPGLNGVDSRVVNWDQTIYLN